MKKIIVCLKQVPDTKEVKIDPQTHTLIREGMQSVLNPFDKFALEEALKLKKTHNFKVITLTMGPPQAIEILKESLYAGADESYLLTDKRLAGSDTWATAFALVSLIKKIGYDLIFCGQESLDSGTGHIGESIAEMLGLPQINYAKNVIGIGDYDLKILAKLDNYDVLAKVKMPAVVSFLKKDKKLIFKSSKEVNFDNIKKVDLDFIGLKASEVGLDGSFTQVINIDIDDRFVGYFVVDSNLKADDRILSMITGGIEVKKDRKIIKSLTSSAVKEIKALIA